jgi:tetratricopeptide (TPR) repeat protein
MIHSTGKYFLTLLIAGLTTGSLEPKPLPETIDQEEYLDADDWFQAGLAFNSESRYDDAAEAFAKSISIDPKNALSWLNLGTAQALLGEYELSIQSLKKSVVLNPQLALAFSNLAEVCFRNEHFKDAAEAYTSLLALWPDNANALYKLGLVHLHLNEAGKAQGEYLTLKRVDPELAEKLLDAITQGDTR